MVHSITHLPPISPHSSTSPSVHSPREFSQQEIWRDVYRHDDGDARLGLAFGVGRISAYQIMGMPEVFLALNYLYAEGNNSLLIGGHRGDLESRDAARSRFSGFSLLDRRLCQFRWAQRVERALRASRIARVADFAAMEDQPVRKSSPLSRGKNLRQIHFDLDRILLACKAKPAR
jgi:hypothetical protein